MDQATVPYGKRILRRQHETWNRAHNPPAWAQHRLEVADAVPWFRTNQGGMQIDPFDSERGYVQGILISRFSGRRSYVDAEVIITSINGEQAGSMISNPTQHRRNFMANSIEDGRAVGIIFEKGATLKQAREDEGGRLSQLLPVNNMPTEGQNMRNCWVGDWFIPTVMWPTKVEGRAGSVWMVRLEKYDLGSQSWWANPMHGQPPLEKDRDFTIQVQQGNCPMCNTDSPRIYNEMFICTNDECAQVGRHNGQVVSFREHLTYTDEFLMARKPRPLNQVAFPNGQAELVRDFNQWHATHYLNPINSNEPFTPGTFQERMNDLLEGFDCPYCNMLNVRIRWHQWHCRNRRCNFAIDGSPPILSLQEVTTMGSSVAPGRDLKMNPGYRYTQDYTDFTALEFELGEGCNITYLIPKSGTNEKPGSSNDLYQEIQKAGKTGEISLERHWMPITPAGPMVTSHFAANYGKPYVFPALVPTTPIEEAHPVVQKALTLVNSWVAPWRTPQDHPANELYLAGYWAGQKMNWHDDGENGLENTITTYTLGGSGSFSVGIKGSYYSGFTNGKGDTVIDYDPVIPGCIDETQRRVLKDQYDRNEITEDEWKTRRLALKYKSTSRNPPHKLFDLPVHHGYLVIMYGPNTQRYMVHSVSVNTPMRFALTFRHITPEHATAKFLEDMNKRIEDIDTYDPGDDWNLPNPPNPVGDEATGEPLPQVSPSATPPPETASGQADPNGNGADDDIDGDDYGNAQSRTGSIRRANDAGERGGMTRRVRARGSRASRSGTRGQ